MVDVLCPASLCSSALPAPFILAVRLSFSLNSDFTQARFIERNFGDSIYEISHVNLSETRVFPYYDFMTPFSEIEWFDEGFFLVCRFCNSIIHTVGYKESSLFSHICSHLQHLIVRTTFLVVFLHVLQLSPCSP